MSERDYIEFIRDIVDAMEKAEKFVSGMSYEEFAKDDKTIFAVIRALEIVGEAVKHIPLDVRRKYSGVPWRDIAGMRDVLIHGYFGVDSRIVWESIEREIPKTKPLVKKILNEMEEGL